MTRHSKYLAACGLTAAAALVTSSLSVADSNALTPAASSVQPAAAVHTAAQAPAATGYADWTTYHGNNLRTGNATTLKQVGRQPTQVWSIGLDGAVYGSPIVVDKGHKLVATENNSVYELAGNKVVWKHNFGAPVPTSSLPCGNINPLGITGTMAYDAKTATVVAVVERSNPFRHVAVGLNPLTGAQKWFRTVDVPSSVGGIIPQAMQQRGALLVSGRTVFIAYGGLAGDCSSYRGSVVGLSLDAPSSAALWHYTVPTSREAGIWAAAGPAENTGGTGIFVAVGNGATAGTGVYDLSDSIIRLAYQKALDSFSPSTWRSDNASDLDLGSQGPTVVGSYLFIAGKSGTAYVLRRNNLGGIGGQVSQASLCKSFGGTAVVANVVYVPCTDGVRAVRINSNGSLTVLWHAASSITGSPVYGGGYVFALDTGAGTL
ncbi:MAG: hypothetical protein ABI140_17325, partial [Jatrophihabitantaceae bacterium]